MQQVSKFMDDRLGNAITAYRAKNRHETALKRLTETWRPELDISCWCIAIGYEQGFRLS